MPIERPYLQRLDEPAGWVGGGHLSNSCALAMAAGAIAVGAEAVVTVAMAALRQHVQHEASYETRAPRAVWSSDGLGQTVSRCAISVRKTVTFATPATVPLAASAKRLILGEDHPRLPRARHTATIFPSLARAIIPATSAQAV